MSSSVEDPMILIHGESETGKRSLLEGLASSLGGGETSTSTISFDTKYYTARAKVHLSGGSHPVYSADREVEAMLIVFDSSRYFCLTSPLSCYLWALPEQVSEMQYSPVSCSPAFFAWLGLSPNCDFFGSAQWCSTHGLLAGNQALRASSLGRPEKRFPEMLKSSCVLPTGWTHCVRTE